MCDMCYLVQVEHLEDKTPQQGQGLSLSCVAWRRDRAAAATASSVSQLDTAGQCISRVDTGCRGYLKVIISAASSSSSFPL